MIDQLVKGVQKPLDALRQHQVSKQLKQEPHLWRVYLQEHVQSHPPPWTIHPSDGGQFWVLAGDGTLLYTCKTKQRAKLVVQAATYLHTHRAPQNL